MKTLLLLATIATPALASANQIIPPAPRIDLSAKPNSLQALKNRAAIIAEQNRIYNKPAPMRVNPPGSTMQFGGPWNLRR